MTFKQCEMRPFALAELDTYNLEGFRIGKDIALSSIEEDLLDDLNDLNSMETKLARHKLFKVDNATVDDYEESLIDLGDGRKVICGIRHYGRDPNLPFINLIPNFCLSSKSEALGVYKLIKDRFEIFSPKFLSFHSSMRMDVDSIGVIYMAILAERIRKLRPWSEEEGLELINISDDSYYDWYVEGYQQFNREYPEMAKDVKANSKELMNESIEQNLLKYAYYKGERIGLIAAVKNKTLGHDDFYFNEILILKKFKGLGLAKAIQRKFIHENTMGHELVWGTIFDKNKASLKTAMSNNRKPIRYECFINLD
ncbi:hypothetical protein ACRXCV_05595 [Halobacteriovorax sp. GFR7]|uniref:hypothetical protein n=1 Tax=unclassified Halobacteriovorax TaxID=2639665 RepID=UPI003D98165C